MIDALVRKTVEAELHRINSTIEWRASDTKAAELHLQSAQAELARLNELRDSLTQFLEGTPPRVWQSLADVPRDLLVSGAQEHGPWYGEGPSGSQYDHYGPFTEVVGE